jgi:hypothetical protein
MATPNDNSPAEFTASLYEMEYADRIASIKDRYTLQSWFAERNALLAGFPDVLHCDEYADACQALGLPYKPNSNGQFEYPEYTPAWAVAQRLAGRVAPAAQPVRIVRPERAARLTRCIDCEREFMSYGETGLDVQCGRCS